MYGNHHSLEFMFPKSVTKSLYSTTTCFEKINGLFYRYCKLNDKTLQSVYLVSSRIYLLPSLFLLCKRAR